MNNHANSRRAGNCRRELHDGLGPLAGVIVVVVVRMVFGGGSALTGRFGRHSTVWQLLPQQARALAQLVEGVGRSHLRPGRKGRVAAGPVGYAWAAGTGRVSKSISIADQVRVSGNGQGGKGPAEHDARPAREHEEPTKLGACVGAPVIGLVHIYDRDDRVDGVADRGEARIVPGAVSCGRFRVQASDLRKCPVRNVRVLHSVVDLPPGGSFPLWNPAKDSSSWSTHG